MQHSCARRCNPRGRSWTGPSRAPASGPSPHNTRETQPSPKESYRRIHRITCNEIAAKSRKIRKSSCIFAVQYVKSGLPAMFFSRRGAESSEKHQEETSFIIFSVFSAPLRETFGLEGFWSRLAALGLLPLFAAIFGCPPPSSPCFAWLTRIRIKPGLSFTCMSVSMTENDH